MPEIKEHLFEMPLYERYIEMSHFASKVKCLRVDEVGVFIYYDKSTPELTTDFIRHHLVGRRRTTAFIEAKDVGEAIRKFYEEWEGAKIGGEHEEAKALWIDRSKPIYELPKCPKLHRGEDDRFTCGKPIHEIADHPDKDDEHWNHNGEFGMCILDGYDSPEEDTCPIRIFYQRIRCDFVTENKLNFVVVSLDISDDIEKMEYELKQRMLNITKPKRRLLRIPKKEGAT